MRSEKAPNRRRLHEAGKIKRAEAYKARQRGKKLMETQLHIIRKVNPPSAVLVCIIKSLHARKVRVGIIYTTEGGKAEMISTDAMSRLQREGSKRVTFKRDWRAIG